MSSHFLSWLKAAGMNPVVLEEVITFRLWDPFWEDLAGDGRTAERVVDY